MPNDFMRPRDGFRYQWKGMKLNSTPDSLPQGKYAMAVNVRALGDDTLQSRPGLVSLFSTNGIKVTDMRAYTGLGTDSLPRILARDSANSIFLDTGVTVGSLSGGGADQGVSMIPFRPNSSPLPWMYISGASDYQKFSAPSATNVVTQQNAGIAEPQSPPEAAVTILATGVFVLPSNTFGGTAGSATSGMRFTDTVAAAFAWPAPASGIYSLQVSTGVEYQRFQNFNLSGGAFGGFVLDVYPSAFQATAIQGIYYYSGTTGRCVVAPATVGPLPATSSQATYPAAWLSSLRRGMLVKIGAEVCFVLNVSVGPNGSICFETTTSSTHTTADTLTGVPSIAVSMSAGVPTASATISYGYNGCAVTAGVGTITSNISTPPFLTGASTAFQAEDYILVSFLIDTLANLNEIKVLFDVGDGSFTENFYYYTIRPSDITAAIDNSLTQLAAAQIVTQRAIIDEEQAVAANNQGQTASSSQTTPGDGQWSEIMFPISALTRVGNDQTLSLQNLQKVQFLFNASNTINPEWADFNVIGGGQVDVGDAGAPLQYRARPRSSLTGARGNPSPATRYGVLPRRQNVTVSLPSASYDSQIDTWDIFRVGGAVTSWRFIGSVPSTSSTFTDMYDDAAATAGEPLDFDNFEPWPTIDLPNNGIASQVAGIIAIVTSANTNMAKYLPGTLVRIGGQNVYTLWTRPVLISGTTYRLQFIENAGAATSVAFNIQEPILANAHLPYMWGPNAYGTVFAVGDPLRPGTVYFCKRFAPDSAPDTFNQEISPPSEPLLGGEVLDGLSFVASSERWWALYPTGTAYIQAVQSATQQFSAIQQPISRGLGAPFGHCTDGQAIYFWAKDGFHSSSKGSLTDADLYNLFPHEGVVGEDVTYNGTTVHAPDYSRAATFRAAHSNGYIYATYQDSGANYRTLVYDIKRDAWCADDYTGVEGRENSPVTCFYHPEQPASALGDTPVRYPELLAANTGGGVAVQTANSNDYSSPISCIVATNEFDGGDIRAPKQWGDFFVDCQPGSTTGTGISFTPMSLGVALYVATQIDNSGLRDRTPIGVGGIVVSDFLGVQAAWIDDFAVQSTPSKLYAWQPSFVVQPARTISWETFGTSYGLDGYMHIRQLSIAYVSAADITITPVSYDGMSPSPITLPSTAGAFKKILVPLSANKGQLYKWTASSSAPFQIFSEDSDIYLGAWGRKGPYLQPSNFGGMSDAAAVI